MTILNACTKKVWKLIECTTYLNVHPYLLLKKTNYSLFGTYRVRFWKSKKFTQKFILVLFLEFPTPDHILLIVIWRFWKVVLSKETSHHSDNHRARVYTSRFLAALNISQIRCFIRISVLSVFPKAILKKYGQWEQLTTPIFNGK